MKKIITLLITIFFIISGFNVIGTSLKVNNTTIESIKDNTFVFTITFPSIDELKFKRIGEYQIIEIENYNFLSDMGKPKLPAKNYLFALPYSL